MPRHVWSRQKTDVGPEPAIQHLTTPIGGNAKTLVRAHCITCGREFLTYQYFRPDTEEENYQEKCSKCR